jgi:hypothetical protein
VSARRSTAIVIVMIAFLVVPAHSAFAFCEQPSATAAAAAATTIFVGKALPGPTAQTEPTLLSPATFAVDHYVKGSGARTLKVETAISSSGGVVTTKEDLIEPRAGQWWMIYSHQTIDGVVQTSFCDGSHLVAAPTRFRAAGALPTTGREVPFVSTLSGMALLFGAWLRRNGARFGWRTWDPARARRI